METARSRTGSAVQDSVPRRRISPSVPHNSPKAYSLCFFLLVPDHVPERLMGANPYFHLESPIGTRHAGLKAFAPEALAEYRRCFRDPAAIHASCEDYRAAESIDLAHDEADIDRKVAAPLLVLWGKYGTAERCFHPLADWAERAENVRGRSLDCGHYIPEEAPAELLGELIG